MKASTLSSCPGVGWLQQWHCCYCGAQTGIRWPRGCGGPWVVALGMGQRAGGMGHGRELGRRCHRAVGQLWRVPGAYQLLEGPLEAVGQPPCVGCCVPEQLPTSRHQWLDVAPGFWVLVPSTSGLWQWLGIKAAPAPHGHGMAFEAFYLGFVMCV